MQETKGKSMAGKNVGRTRQNPNALFVTLTITDEWYLAIFVS